MVPLIGAFTAIARTLSKTWNVQVIPSGYEAKTDGTRIFIPFNADYVKPETRRVLHGLLDHELLHVLHERRHKDRGLDTPLTIKSKLSSKEGLWYNVMLDIAIESQCYMPGMRENLEYKNELLCAMPSVGESQRRVVLFISLSRKTKSYKMPEDLAWMAELLEEEIDIAPQLYWANDVLELARVVVSKLDDHDEKKEEEAKEEGDDGKAGRGGDEAEDDGESHDRSAATIKVMRDDEDSADGSDGDEPSASEGAEDDSEEDGLKGRKKGELEGGSGTEESDSDDYMTAFREHVSELVKEDTHGMYVPNPKAVEADRWTVWKDGIPLGESQLAPYRTLSKLGESAVGAMKARQLMYLKTQGRLLARLESDQGDLDPGLLSQVRTGNRDVFVGEKFAPKIDTAIEILLDLSGSMRHGAKDMQMSIAAVAVAESLDAGSIPFEMIGFHNLTSKVFVEDTPGTINRPPFEYIQFKGWNESLHSCRERFEFMSARLDNADGEAVLRVAQRLAQRKERRRVLVVLSDGEPHCYGLPHDVGRRHLMDVVRRVSRSGIEVIGGGIMTDSVREFYNSANEAKFFQIDNVSELPNKFLGCLGLMPR